MGNRMYYSNDVTVLSYGADTGLLTKLGDGTLRCEAATLENNALADAETDFGFGPKTYTFDGELACEDDENDWFSRVGGAGTLTFSSDTETISGTFGVVSAEKVLGGALRWRVTLRNKGTVTVT